MVMSWIFTGMVLLSILGAGILGRGDMLAGAAMEGAGAGITLSVSMAGALALWSGTGRLLEAAGVTEALARCLRPLLRRLFPQTRKDPALARDLSANLCANLLGLGNAATPMGISAVKRMKRGEQATDAMCRLIVLNTASIQLIPTTVAALRSGLGCTTPFDILPAVWITSALSVGAGLGAAWIFGKLWRRD